MSNVKIEAYPVGEYHANCYLIYDQDTNEGVMIDPGDEGEVLCTILASKNIKCRYVLATHSHADHLGGLNMVLDYTDAIFAMNYDHVLEIMRSRGQEMEVPPNAINLKDGDEIVCGSITIKALETPGHTPDSMCFVYEDAMFTGDTLMRDSCGAGSDIKGSDWAVIQKSLKRIARMGDFDIYPGHGGMSTMERERKENVYVKSANAWRPSDDEPGAEK